MGYLRRKKHPWRNGLLIAAVALPALYALAGFLVLPAVLQGRAETQLAAALHRPVSIGKVRTNPFTFTVAVEKLEVRERDGPAVFLGWERLLVDFAASSLWGDAWRFAVIELDAPHGRIVAGKDGALNFSDLLQDRAEEETDAAKPAATSASGAASKPALAGKPVHIARLVLHRARVDFRDEGLAQPFATTLGPVSLLVRDFRTVSEANAPYTFEAVTESGERLSWRGGIQAAPFRSKGELTISDLVLKKYAPYYEERTGLAVADGRLTVQGRYELNFDTQNRVLKLLEGSLTLRDVRIVERATGGPVLELPAVDLAGATADGTARSADVREVKVQGGSLRLRREKNGGINLLMLLRPSAPPPPVAAALPAAATVEKRASSFTVGKVKVSEFGFAVEDLTPTEPGRLALARVDFSLNDFTLVTGARMPVRLAFDWLPRGAVRVDGTMVLSERTADLKVELDGVDATPLNPYLGALLDARLTQGLVSLGGAVKLTGSGGAPAVEFDGQAWLEKFSITTGTNGVELAAFSDLVFGGVKVTTAPEAGVSVATVNLIKPVAQVVIGNDGALNLAGLRRNGAPDAPAAGNATAQVVFGARPAEPAAGPAITIGRLVIDGGELSFSDESIQPGVRLALEQFGGTLTGLSSYQPGRGRADLQGRVNGTPWSISGRLEPLAAAPSFDLKADWRDLDLRPFSPYSGKYAGFELARGRLTLEAAAKLVERRLDMENSVTLDGLEFGNATDSADATKLPVRLGVALLKDREGRIVLDVPVRGSLDDPEFKIGRVAGRVISNLLRKAATSPFALLGSMLGGAGDELGWQEFAPGKSVLSEQALAKLDALAKALAERPGLQLAISGGFAPVADAAVFRERKFHEMVRASWRERKPAAEPAAEMPEDAEVPAEEFTAAVKHIFDRRFPPGTALGTPLPEAPPIETPPPPDPDANLLKRVYHWLTLHGPRERTNFRLNQERIQREFLAEAQKIVDAGLPLEVMTERLMAVIEVDEAELQALAAARRTAVRDHLLKSGQIGHERFVEPREMEGVVRPDGNPRVTLELR